MTPESRVFMAIEIEKKFRLTAGQFEELESKITALGAMFQGERFERNVLYSNDHLDENGGIVRLREAGESVHLTFKRGMVSENGLKTQLEFETDVGSFEEAENIIEHIGLRKRLIYEKRRKIWEYINAEVVLDELPFGLFIEIEGTQQQILFIEKVLGLNEVSPELKTYPMLTAEFGQREGDTIIAKF